MALFPHWRHEHIHHTRAAFIRIVAQPPDRTLSAPTLGPCLRLGHELLHSRIAGVVRISAFSQPFRADDHLELQTEIRPLALACPRFPFMRPERLDVIQRPTFGLAPSYWITVPNMPLLGDRIEPLCVPFRCLNPTLAIAR
mgnify:CR=1 FL=1